MLDLFKETLPSILQTGNSIISNDNEDEYPPFIVNRALSQHMDCVVFANEMNVKGHAAKKMQYDFLLNSIRKYKRPFKKWSKPEDDKERDRYLNAIMVYYDYSRKRAEEAITILTKEQLDKLVSKFGGVIKNE